MESYLVSLLLFSSLIVVKCNSKGKDSIKTSIKIINQSTSKKENKTILVRSRGGGKNTTQSHFYSSFYSSSNEKFGHALERHVHDAKKKLFKTKQSALDKWNYFKDKFLHLNLSSLNLSNLTQFTRFFNLYQKFFRKNYTEQDRKERFGIILNTVKSIQEHNANISAKFMQGINELSDMKWSEIISHKLGLMVESEIEILLPSRVSLSLSGDIPKSWDWRKYGILTPVRNQGKCGSCWSFAAATVLESHNMKRLIAEGKFNPKKSPKLTVSEQNMIDCSEDFGTMACKGGMPQQAFKFVSAKGVMSAEAYPYKGKKGNCSFDPKKKVDAKIKEGKRIWSGQDDDLEKAIYIYGPVAIAVHVTKIMTSYKKGIFEDRNCDHKRINHAVVAVGYTKEYFIVRNSWGPEWGEKGYIRISRNKINACGVSEQSYYPIIPGAVKTNDMINKLVVV